jgi:hypothetical protein
MDRVQLFCLFCLLTVPVGAEPVASVDESGFIPFARLDSDDNGYVSRVEAGIASGIREAFDAADANRDGLLDRHEYPAVQAAVEVR